MRRGLRAALPALPVLLVAVSCAAPPGPLKPPTGLLSEGDHSIPLQVHLALKRTDDPPGQWLRVLAAAERHRLILLRREQQGTMIREAGWEWRLVIRTPSGRQVGGQHYVDAVELGPDESPEDLDARVMLDIAVPLPPGRYRVEVRIHDRHSIRRGRQEYPIEVEGWRRGEAGLSSPRWWHPQEGESPQLFGRIPEQGRRLYWTCEYYEIPPGSRVRYRLLDAAGRSMRLKERELEPASRQVVVDSLDIGEVPEGPGRLEVTLEGGTIPAMTVQAELYIERPIIEDGRRLEATVAQLPLYADSATVARFRTLEEVERVALIDSLWQAHESRGAGRSAQARQEFARRLRLADRQWGQGSRRGWETDPGRIFVTWGRPREQIEGRTILPARSPLEEPRERRTVTWMYDDPPVVFVFVVTSDRSWTLVREASSAIPPDPVPSGIPHP